MGNRKRALKLGVVAGIIGLAVPLASSAAIAVVPPAGNADPAVMDELQVALETVAAGTATEVDGVFWLSAEPSGEELSIAVGLSSSDGREIARESRVASRASAAAQVRAMARAVIRAATAPRPAVVTISEESKKVTPSAPARPVLNSPYDQRRVFWVSAGPTLGGLVLGGAMIGLSFVDGYNVPALAIGASIAGMSFLVGPSLGHFIVGNNLQGSLTLVFRTLLSAGATAFFAFGSVSASFSSDPCGFMGCSEEEYDEGVDKQEHSDSGATGFFVGGALTATAAVTLMIVDLATVRRAAQRANEKAAAAKEAEPKISNVSFAPTVAPGPNGSMTAGLAFSMQF